jgi:hypothetical protein
MIEQKTGIKKAWQCLVKEDDYQTALDDTHTLGDIIIPMEMLVCCVDNDGDSDFEDADDQVISNIPPQVGHMTSEVEAGDQELEFQAVHTLVAEPTHGMMPADGTEVPTFTVDVDLLSGRNVAFQVTPFTTIEDVKKMIQDQEGYSIFQQGLVLGETVLHNWSTLNDYNITHGTTLQLVATPLQIKVCFNASDEDDFIMMPINCDTTVDDIKYDLSKLKEWWTIEQQSVYTPVDLDNFNDIDDMLLMEDSRTLDSYNLADGNPRNVIYVFW